MRWKQKFRPLFGEEGGDPVGEQFALVVDVLEDVLGPLHQVADLVARGGTVDAPRQGLVHLVSQNILEAFRKVYRSLPERSRSTHPRTF